MDKNFQTQLPYKNVFQSQSKYLLILTNEWCYKLTNLTLAIVRLISAIAEDLLHESQCGFRANRGTTDMVFVLRQLQEKCREQNKGLYVTFVDLTKAFDTVSIKAISALAATVGTALLKSSFAKPSHDDDDDDDMYSKLNTENVDVIVGILIVYK
ncbi:RNA-directed DNA polymerase from mobile element jockey-like [Pitangus sulphuratus]|nr:RNA-directed DNA polymerase from mobile element jockey-like [Pitangus sulphuratus]